MAKAFNDLKSKHGEEKRDKSLTLMLSPTELQVLSEAAREARVSRVQFVVNLLDGYTSKAS